MSHQGLRVHCILKCPGSSLDTSTLTLSVLLKDQTSQALVDTAERQRHNRKQEGRAFVIVDTSVRCVYIYIHTSTHVCVYVYTKKER